MISRGPKTMGNVLSELMARKGYARVRSAETFEAAWREAAGPLAAQYTRVGQIKRGTLEVMVNNSVLVQELGFQKRDLLIALARILPDEKIQDIRFRVGPIN